ncbi:MAG: FAD-binding oxidoreductase [Cellvibrionaceae bacterium]
MAKRNLIFIMLVCGSYIIQPSYADNQKKSAVLQPFTSDGCSAFPDGTLDQKRLWLSCCTDHDRAYWLGGSYRQRQFADKALQQCVAQVGEPEIALVMLAGVRVGGSPYWISPFRWGYGWPYFDGWLPRGYKGLSDQDKKLAEDLTLTKIGEEKGDSDIE